ncbi:hypothetical protein GCM10028820_13220 [Tessaracoccus terricola]
MSVAGRAVVLVLTALSALLVGCGAPSDAEVIRQTVHAVHDEAEGVPGDARAAREAHDVAVLEWASEAGHQEPVTVDELRALQAEGSDPYGPTSLSFWNFYQEWLAAIEEDLRSDVRDSLGPDEVRAFYDENPEQFERQDRIVVTVVPWRDGRAGDSYSLTIDEDSVRRLQEANDLLVAAALELEEGEQVVVDLPDGTQLQVTCESRTDGDLVPFDEVVQAAASQLATQRYAAELERRIGG